MIIVALQSIVMHAIAPTPGKMNESTNELMNELCRMPIYPCNYLIKARSGGGANLPTAVQYLQRVWST